MKMEVTRADRIGGPWPDPALVQGGGEVVGGINVRGSVYIGLA